MGYKKFIINLLEQDRIEYFKDKVQFMCYTPNEKWKMMRVGYDLYFDRKDKNGRYGNYYKIARQQYCGKDEKDRMNNYLICASDNNNRDILYYFMGGGFYKSVCGKLFFLSLKPLSPEENQLFFQLDI